jgi:predicted dehydrogenase
MVLSPLQARELQTLAVEKKLEVIIDYPYHYNSQSVRLRQLVKDRLGRIEFVSCLFSSLVREYYRGDTEAYQPEFKLARAPRNDTYSDPALSGGGQGQTQVTHSAALLFWLTGLRPRRVLALCENFGLPVDLVDAAAVGFEGGALGTISSTGDRPTGHDDVLQLHISGTDGYAIYDVMEGRARVLVHGGEVEHVEGPPMPERYPHWAPADNLVDIVLQRGTNQSPAEIGVMVVDFLDAMYRSAAAGGSPCDITG